MESKLWQKRRRDLYKIIPQFTKMNKGLKTNEISLVEATLNGVKSRENLEKSQRQKMEKIVSKVYFLQT